MVETILMKNFFKKLRKCYKNNTEVGIQYYKGIIGLTVEMLMRDKIHLDERRNEKINELLSKR